MPARLPARFPAPAVHVACVVVIATAGRTATTTGRLAALVGILLTLGRGQKISGTERSCPFPIPDVTSQ